MHKSVGKSKTGVMIELIIEDEAWEQSVPDLEQLALDCHKAAVMAEPDLDGEIALLAAGDEALQALNMQFRQIDRPTNVLSFPSDQPPGFLGDIAIAQQICAKEAAEKGIRLRNHAAHLIVHGMLHLIGYDHQETAEAEAMERREAVILASMGIADPYSDAQESCE